MKLARCSHNDTVFWGLVDKNCESLTPIVGDFSTWAPELTTAITEGRGDNASKVLPLADQSIALKSVHLLPPVEPINRIVIAGANYAKHLAADFGLTEPSQPVAFLKSYGALIGATDPIRYPPLTEELDHEVELVVSIGKSPIDLDDPMSCVLGYTVGNDVSSRDLQRSGPKGIGMDLFAAKSQDKTTGVGPWIVTKDEFPNGSDSLELILKVDGETRQHGTTADMTWNVAQLIQFVEQRSSFSAGDIMFTGSPEGVGQGTGKYLNPGELVEASIEGIGSLKNVVSAKTTAWNN